MFLILHQSIANNALLAFYRISKCTVTEELILVAAEDMVRPKREVYKSLWQELLY